MQKLKAECPSCKRAVESRVIDGAFFVIEHDTCAPIKIEKVKPAPLTLAEAHALIQTIRR